MKMGLRRTRGGCCAAVLGLLVCLPCGARAVGGDVWGWGYNNMGQLGDGTSATRFAPVRSGVGAKCVGVAAGCYHGAALAADGTVTWWGMMWDVTPPGQQPRRVIGLDDVVQVASGHSHMLALRRDGTVWAWGNNTDGQLGTGTTVHQATPVRVLGLADVVQIACGHYHSLALHSDGTVSAWGRNDSGQLGDGSTTNRATPVQVVGLTNVVSVGGGKWHSAALRGDGSAWAWGNGAYAQLGTGYWQPDAHTPVPVQGVSGVKLAVGGEHNLVLTADGHVAAWGHVNFGQANPSGNPYPSIVAGVEQVVEVAGGWAHSIAVRADGTWYAWGEEEFGQYGGGSGGPPRLVTGAACGPVLKVVAGFWHNIAVAAAPNQAPVASDSHVTTDEDVTASAQMVAVDPDGDALSYTVVAGPQHGRLAGIAPDIVYVPDEDFSGTDAFSFKVCDGVLESGIATVSVVVSPVNDAPVADAGPDIALEARGPVTVVTLSGASSSDVDGDTLSYVWTEGERTVGSGPTPCVGLTVGVHRVTLTVTDVAGASSADEVVVNVIDSMAPTVSGVAVDKPLLWPPSHKMIDVRLSYSCSDIADSCPVTKVSVVSDEPDNGIGDGDTAGDCEVVDAHHVRLRAERSGSGNGRTYTITIRCTDASGNASSTAVQVRVPKSQGR